MPVEGTAVEVANTVRARILTDLTTLAEYSEEGPGVTRLAYSREDAQGREWFARRCEEAGLRFEIDDVGNCFGWSPGAGEGALLLGSHLDSVINGGRYDGALGVATAFAIVEAVLQAEPTAGLGVVAFACEESTRFGIGTLGSRAYVGELSPDDRRELRDLRDDTFAAVLARAGLGRGVVERERLRAFIEVHVDQGSTLSSAGTGVGIAEYIAGSARVEVIWKGTASHSGGRRRDERRDALLAAAEFTLSVDRLWADLTGETFLAITIGRLEVEPNSPNTVAGKVRMIVDVRSGDADLLAAVLERLDAIARDVARIRRTEVATRRLGFELPVALDGGLIDTLAAAADDERLPVIRMPSHGGHDAAILAERIPAALVFVANPSGLSHSPEEALSVEGLRDAVRLLLRAIPRCVNTNGI